jgi:hypothetical protein
LMMMMRLCVLMNRGLLLVPQLRKS